MKNISIILFFLGVYNSFVFGQNLEEAVLCEAVKSMQPVNPKTNFQKGEKAYCWIKVSNAVVGSKIKVAWQYNDVTQYTSQLSIKYATMRTYTYKTLTAEGTWAADILSSEGELLKSISFTVGGKESNKSKSIPANEIIEKEIKKEKQDQVVTKKDYSKPNKLVLKDGFQIEIKEDSKVVLPPGYDKSKKYPALFFLPPTGMSGEEMYMNYCYMAYNHADLTGQESGFERLLKGLYPTKNERNNKSFIVILPGGRGSTKDHSWEGFSACIYRYEQKVLNDLETIIPKYNIDPKKIVLTGFSLGGDLSWAITHRYPGKFKGAIVMGSRCSYHEKGKLELIAENNEKYYLVMGENESEIRLKIFNQTKDLLDKNKIKYLYRKVPNEGHAPATFDQFREALDFVMFDTKN